MNQSESEAGWLQRDRCSCSKVTMYYSKLKFEGGTHRVQRVPATESQGRVHTSAITVAVMPEVDDVEIEINANDLKIDVMRSSGCGGQSVNTTDSAVRITHYTYRYSSNQPRSKISAQKQRESDEST